MNYFLKKIAESAKAQ